MKIGLLDIDGHNFPNVALMKIADWHRLRGDYVEWAIPLLEYDRIYASKVFTFSPDIVGTKHYRAKEIICGGTGYNVKSRLPDEIERHTGLAYDFYPQHPFSVQWYSRGCIRRCPFCLVHDKEGDIHPVPPLSWNPNAKWIEVLDNNFFASPNWREAIADLKRQRLPVKFSGVDIRIMDEEQAAALNSVRLKGHIHIAWDLPQLDLTPKLKEVVKYLKPYKIVCYVLVGYNSSREQDLYRVQTLKQLGILPFVQPYRDYGNSRKPTQYEKDLGRWANRAWLFRTMDFGDYEPRKGFRCREYLV